MQKPLGIQKCDGPTDGPTDRPTYRPTRQGVEPRVHNLKGRLLLYKQATQSSTVKKNGTDSQQRNPNRLIAYISIQRIKKQLRKELCKSICMFTRNLWHDRVRPLRWWYGLSWFRFVSFCPSINLSIQILSPQLHRRSLALSNEALPSNAVRIVPESADMFEGWRRRWGVKSNGENSK